MSATFRCDGCGSITDKPTLRIERTDGFGGGGIRVSPGQDWHLCHSCAVALDVTLARLKTP